ncbi:MAG: hypothetical protein ACLFQL_06520 [Paracoccaceae bacterium]
MHVIRSVVFWLGLLAVTLVGGCATHPADGPKRGTEREIADLAAQIEALGPEVDPEEAARAARIAYAHTHRLALEYEITDPPLVHNTKVNLGLKPRGLCWHWAEDMETRLKEEEFRTLRLHRAIANADNPFRIDHSTAIISSRGAGMFDGIVLDPWRKGGVLFWAPTRSDTDYNWRPQHEVLSQKRERARSRALLFAE